MLNEGRAKGPVFAPIGAGDAFTERLKPRLCQSSLDWRLNTATT
jgi:hypothetical protein